MGKRDSDDCKGDRREDDRESTREDRSEHKSYDREDGRFSEGDRQQTPSVADTIEPPSEPPKKK
jgi:hypothetical protein